MANRAMPERDPYPNNSDRAKEAQIKKPVKKEVAKVTKGKVRQRKKPLGRRFAEAFGAKEGQGVVEYILYDIIIPATKNMLLDSISDGVEMALFGEVRSRRRRPSYGGQRSRYEYDRVSYRSDDRRDARDRRDRPRANMRDYEDILFDSKADAEEVITGLVDMIDQYGQATVADLYDLSGVTPEYTMDNYGWTNLSSATSSRTRDGYVLNLPRAVLL